MLDFSDMYIIKNDNGDSTGVLEVDVGFDIMKLKDFTLTEALVYLDKHNIRARYRGGVKGALHFKKD